ncbi:TRAFAC clade GTPase domain-containing protein [Actinoplanes couchii]|uniref:Double-GTPase 2 domain-containing protein n=1 Tax=Actinoplanes couchii TaxID=403638 RepID=A0ABQ3X006_9ACTN|nr:hypothetical protein [Actinoplanes couchii]MDR6316182.1 hypothetical protein [Actinoplanes couchii]GID51797.1 hypothetical protein Aco03nite_002010 [Actinoplanes couchii]
MPVVMVVVVIVLGLCCLWLVVVPLSLALAPVAVIAGTVAALIGGLMTFAGGGPVPLTPAGARTWLPGRVRGEFVRRDHAWPHYFAAQVVLDGADVLGRALRWNRALGKHLFGFLGQESIAAAVPLTLLPVLVMRVGGALGLLAGTLAVLVVTVAVTAVMWLIGLPVVLLMRGVDRVWRVVRRSRASCVVCFATAAVPAYRCLGPHLDADRMSGDDLHRDVRPGRLGVLWRRCSCELRLPTTVLRAARDRRLEGLCPSCEQPLFSGAGVHREVRLPVFGAASAGKTQFVMSALVGLHAAAQRAGIPIEMADDRSRAVYSMWSGLTARSAPAPKTATNAPVTVTTRIRQRRGTTLLHLFDAAGETLVDRRQNATLAYLDAAGTLTFVLDPFSIPRIRDEHGTASAAVFREASAALHDPQDGYDATAQRLREYGVPTGRRRLAFVVTKADLLARLPLTPPTAEPAAVRAWLCDQGLENLVVTAERDFRTVGWFLVSGRDTGPDGPPAVLRWALGRGWGNLA